MSLIYAAQIKTDDGKIGVYHDGSLNLPKRLTVVPAVDVAVDVDPSEPAKRRWWETTVGDLINDRRARRGKDPIDFTAA